MGPGHRIRKGGKVEIKLTPSVGKALANARMAKMKPDGKSMTQKDLATSVNAKPQDVGQLLVRRRLLAAPDS